MQWTLISGRLQPEPFETNRTIARSFDEITRTAAGWERFTGPALACRKCLMKPTSCSPRPAIKCACRFHSSVSAIATARSGLTGP
jgi:hypothetical protein